MEHKNKINIYEPSILYIVLLLIGFTLSNSKIFAQVPEMDWPIEIVSEGHGFTEGPALASDGKIYFTDMDNSNILVYNPATNATNIWNDNSRKANGLIIRDNHLFACESESGAVVKYNLSHGPDSREVLTSTFKGDSLGSPNDLTIIENNLYFSEFWLHKSIEGTGRKQEIYNSRVYNMSLETNSLDSINFSFELTNGIARSPDGQYLYIADWKSNKIYKAYVNGGVLEPLILVSDLNKYELDVGPDGLAVTNDGFIFVAIFWKAKMVLVINPEGNAIGYLPTGDLTTNCVLADDDKTLYITADKKLKRVKITE